MKNEPKQGGVEVIPSQYTASNGRQYATVEIAIDGMRVISFGKHKARAIIEATRDAAALRQLEEFSGHRTADIEAQTAAAVAADRNKYDAAYEAAGMGQEVAR